MQYQRGGSGIPQQNRGGETVFENKKRSKSPNNNLSQPRLQTNNQPGKETTNLSGPFSLDINSNSRPQKKRDDINQIPTQVTASKAYQLPFSNADRSKSSDTEMSIPTPTLRNQNFDDKDSDREQSGPELNQNLEQMQTDSLNQKSTSDTLFKTMANEKRHVSIEVEQVYESIAGRITTVIEVSSDDYQNTHSSNNQSLSLKAKNVPPSEPNATPSFNLERENDAKSSARASEAMKKSGHAYNALITDNSSLDLTHGKMPDEFDQPINKRGNIMLKSKTHSSNHNVHVKQLEMHSRNPVQNLNQSQIHESKASSQSRSSHEMTQTISNDQQTTSNDSFAYSKQSKQSVRGNKEKQNDKHTVNTLVADGVEMDVPDARNDAQMQIPLIPIPLPNRMTKNKSDPSNKKSPSRNRNRKDDELQIIHTPPESTSNKDDESLVSQSISNYSKKTTPMAHQKALANEECTFGRAANLASRIEHTFGRKNELQKKIESTFGQGANLKQTIQQTFGKGNKLQQQIQQTFGKSTNLASKIASELNISQQLKQVEQQQLRDQSLQEQSQSSQLSSKSSNSDATPQTFSSHKYHADAAQILCSKDLKRQNTDINLKRMMGAGASRKAIDEFLLPKKDPTVSQHGKHPNNFFNLERSLIQMRRDQQSDNSDSARGVAQQALIDDELKDSVPDHSACFEFQQDNEFHMKQTSSIIGYTEIRSADQRSSNQSLSTQQQLKHSKSISQTKIQKHSSTTTQYGDMSPQFRNRQTLEFKPVQRRLSARSFDKMKQIKAIEKGRAPRVPFVTGIRSTLKRGTTQKPLFKRLSPPDKAQARREQQSDQLSADEVASKVSITNLTTRPEDLIQKYKNHKVNSLKLSVYKDVTLRIFQTINIIKQIEQFPKIPEILKIDFQFKKSGYKKLLIFDLDETLIHTKRDEDDVDDVEFLVELYGEDHLNLEPDIWIEMTPPDSDGDVFQSGFFIRPHVYDLLRTANLDYEVAVFTAGYDWYANPILDYLDPDGTLIQHRFFRQECQTVTHKGQDFIIKNLDVFRNLNLDNVLIVDNQVFSFAGHLGNGIPCVDFLGQKGDQELIKVMKYVHEISKEDNIRAANERMFRLQELRESPIDKFIKYYSIDELSESDDDNDFEDDGVTVIPDGPPAGAGGQIAERESFSSSPREGHSAFGDSAKLAHNESIGNSGIDEAMTPTEMFTQTHFLNKSMRKVERASTSGLTAQFRALKTVQKTSSSASSQSDRASDAILDQQSQGAIPIQNGGHRDQVQSANRRIEDQLERVDTQDVIQFSSREQYMAKNDGLKLRQNKQLSPTRSPRKLMEKRSSFGQNPRDMATSSYFKVRQTTQQMNKLRYTASVEASLRIGTMSTVESGHNQYFTPASLPKRGPLKSMIQSNVSPMSHAAQSQQPRSGKPPRPHLNVQVAVKPPIQQQNKQLLHAHQSQQGVSLPSESKTNSRQSTISNLYEDEESLQVNNGNLEEGSRLELNSLQSPAVSNVAKHTGMNDSFNKQLKQKTSTSVKKSRKNNNNLLTLSEQQQLQNKDAISYMDDPYNNPPNFTNILQPPNWTKRKHALMLRKHTSASPSCASNIDYHLDKLASCYKKSKGELIDVLMKQNPNNIRFTTSSKANSENKSKSSDIGSKFNAIPNQPLLKVPREQPKSNFGRHSTLPLTLGENRVSTAAQVYMSSGRIAVGEGLIRSADKNQAGQIRSGPPSLYKESEEAKHISPSIPQKRRPDQKQLTGQFTFADLEMVEVYHQQSIELQEKLEKQLLIDPNDKHIGEIIQMKSEFSFKPVNSEVRDRQIVPTGGSAQSPNDMDNCQLRLQSSQNKSGQHKQVQLTSSAIKEATAQLRRKTTLTNQDIQKSNESINFNAGEPVLKRKSTKVEINLGSLQNYLNVSRNSKESKGSTVEHQNQ